MQQYLAHSPIPASPDGQLIKDHDEAVAILAASFARLFGGDEDAYECGLRHDIGKYMASFQRHIRGAKYFVDHAIAGAMLMFDAKNIPAAMCILGHHGGLSDIGFPNDLSASFMGQINNAKRDGIADFSAWKKELPPVKAKGSKNLPGFGIYFYVKMLFSTLVDADWTDTGTYYQNGHLQTRLYNLPALLNQLHDYVAQWECADGQINAGRRQILDDAVKKAVEAPGMFSLTAPTGSGKTIASMAFALKHAVQHKKQRIIYVMPYGASAEQTRLVFEKVFGADSFVVDRSELSDHGHKKPKREIAIYAENWDAPIILTSADCFFESLFSNKPMDNRKLHRIVDSVIVFDGIQMLPIPYLKPCLAVIGQLVEQFHCTTLFSMATQFPLQSLLASLVPDIKIREICENSEAMHEVFRRVTYVDDGRLSDNDLVSRLSTEKQVLCIVNSCSHAKKLYNLLKEKDGSYHLSSVMTPYDQMELLKVIGQRLMDGQPCRVIATSGIEADADLDFPTVYRALASLDSMIQAAGRCNREGNRKTEESFVHIFRPEGAAPKLLVQNISVSVRTMERHPQIDDQEAVNEYYGFLFGVLMSEKGMDKHDILSSVKKLQFQTVSEDFHFSDGASCVVYVPRGEDVTLFDSLHKGGLTMMTLRRLEKYAVHIYPEFYEYLCDRGAIEQISHGIGILRRSEFYSDETGLSRNRIEVPDVVNLDSDKKANFFDLVG